MLDIKLIYFLLSYFVFCDGQGYGTEERIVGGISVNIANYPYQVSLLSFNRHFCGGSLISNHWIVTAAHCVTAVDLRTVNVRAGSSFWNNGGQVRGLRAYAVHPYWNRNTIDYDYALLQVNSPFVYSPAVASITMAPYNFNLPGGERLLVSGWGKLMQGSQTLPTQLQAVNITSVDWYTCRYNYVGRMLTNRMICAWAPGKDSCQGDSGGPAVFTEASGQKLLTAIVSYGFGCNNGVRPSVYAYVPKARDWIKRITGI